MLILLLACTEPAPVPALPPPPVVQDAAPEADDGQRFVMASTLNLRDGGGNKVGRLAINTPVQVLEQAGERSRVHVANGREGWVATEFLGERQLQPTELLALAESTADPALRLSSLQRAAAIAPERSTLVALEQAYRDQGDPRRASVVAQQLAWPVHLKPVASVEGVQIEFPLSWAGAGNVDQRRARTRSTLPVREGAPVWVLPAYGPAVQGTVSRVYWEGRNECSGESAWMAEIDAPLPEGERALVVSLAPPPPSWQIPVPPPTLSQAAAEALLVAKLDALFGDVEILPQAPYREGPNWRVVMRRELPWDESEAQDTMFGFARRVTLETTPSGGVTVLYDAKVNLDNEDFEDWRVSRDLSGDGVLEELRFSDCNTRVYRGEEVQAFTIYRCCGC